MDLVLTFTRWPVLKARFGGRGRRASMWVLALLFTVCGAQSAHAAINITPVTWDVIGLDSNRVTDGPDTFQVGARVCNTGATQVTNVVSTFTWDSANAYINLNGSNTVLARSLAAGACVDFYYPVKVTRTALAYGTARRYHITASADSTAAVSTPTPRQLYVEQLLSQARNTVVSITGPTTVYVGQTYTYTLTASTATQGYEQLEAFLDLSNVIFQVQTISTTYTAPAGATNNKFYADACGWNSDPLSPTYRSCVGPANYTGGKVGGTVVSTYTVKILSTGVTTASALILDVSGGSYHYNSDYGTKTISVTALPPPLTLTKLANPSQVLRQGTSTFTLQLTNTGTSSFTVTDFVDTLPTTPAQPTYQAGSSTFNSSPIPDPAQSGSTLTWRGSFVVPAGQTRNLNYTLSMPQTTGTYVNSAVALIDYIQIDTTSDTSDNSPASASVVVSPPPNVTLVKSVSPSGVVLPSSDLAYTIAFTNEGGWPANTFVILDQIPANTHFKIGSPATNLGSTGLTVSVNYSNDNGTTWTYTPVSGGGGALAGYDGAVTHVRWSFGGNLSPTSPNNTGSVAFVVRVL
ncbi:MAG TPA: hypothetical protein VGB73_17155 [Pyrinomonadaceae bacterium]